MTAIWARVHMHDLRSRLMEQWIVRNSKETPMQMVDRGVMISEKKRKKMFRSEPFAATRLIATTLSDHKLASPPTTLMRS